MTNKTYQFEIAQFYCEIAQAALFKSNFDAARYNIGKALEANKKMYTRQHHPRRH